MTTTDPRSPDGSDKLTEESKEAVEWVEAGFNEYADIIGRRGQYWAAQNDDAYRSELDRICGPPQRVALYRGEIHEAVCSQIERYGKEFGRILRDDDVEMSDEDDPPALRRDLYHLMKSGCPAPGLVELMLACTSGYGVTIPDLLGYADFLNRYLKELETPPEDRTISCRPHRYRGAVPLSLQFMLERMPYYTNVDEIDPTGRVAFHLAYFYIFLKELGRGHKTLAIILNAMHFVRRAVPSVADYLETRDRDPFTEFSVQRRVCRYFETYPLAENDMIQEVRTYLSRPSDGPERDRVLLDIF